MSAVTTSELSDRCETIEKCYEFLLAFAAQGLSSDQGSSSGAQLRDFLAKFDAALDGLSELYGRLVEAGELKPADRCAAFGDVLAVDARSARAAVRLVNGQPSVSSQLVDNLNASIHVRALLTDLFLIDEILKPTTKA